MSEELILGDPSLSILEGVILPWGAPDGYLRRVILPGLAKQLKFDLNVAWQDLPPSVRRTLLYGVDRKNGAESAGKAKPKTASRHPATGNVEWEGLSSIMG